jgi:hypothetical protein
MDIIPNGCSVEILIRLANFSITDIEQVDPKYDTTPHQRQAWVGKLIAKV